MDMGPLPKPIFNPIGSRSGITFSPHETLSAVLLLWSLELSMDRSLKLQPRSKYMLWKITWNSLLPARANIGTFIQYGDTDSWHCQICKGSQETTHHVFLDCPIAKRNSRQLQITVLVTIDHIWCWRYYYPLGRKPRTGSSGCTSLEYVLGTHPRVGYGPDTRSRSRSREVGNG
jgi:hypothetical protein